MRYLEPIATVALLLAALLACGSGGNAKPEKTEPEPSQAADRVASTTVKALVADYRADEEAADAKWKDKTVDVVGTVGDVGTLPEGQRFVSLEGPANEQLGCVLRDADGRNASKWTKGTRATFRGNVLGASDGIVVMDDCERLASGTAPVAGPQPRAPGPRRPPVTLRRRPIPPAPPAPPPPSKPAAPPRKR